jgi:hypothetical protein
MKFSIKTIMSSVSLSTLSLVSSLIINSQAHAGAVMTFGDNQSLSLGLGIRSDFTSDTSKENSGAKNTFTVDDVRLYMNGTFNQYIKATFNTDIQNPVDSNGNTVSTVSLLDAILRFEFTDGFNLWLGRLLPPSDRANLDGPYYANSWAYPGVVSKYPSVAIGRDNGLDVWGKLFNKKLVYVVGVFNGFNSKNADNPTTANQGHDMLYAGRLTYNFLEAEDNPAYYTSSTYYGSQDVLSVGIASQYQANAIGYNNLANASTDSVGTKYKGNFFAWNVDALFEKKLATAGTLTIEGAYYDYNTEGYYSMYSNPEGVTQGTAYLGSIGYLLPMSIGWGQIQPLFRFQNFKQGITYQKVDRFDYQVNYIIKGHNARITADYYVTDTKTGSSASSIPKDSGFTLGLQFQY